MEKRRMGLDALRPGEYGVLREILMPGEAKARMEELGLLPETELSCLYRAPHMSPAAYAVGGAVFALRKRMRRRSLWRRSDEPERTRAPRHCAGRKPERRQSSISTR